MAKAVRGSLSPLPPFSSVYDLKGEGYQQLKGQYSPVAVLKPRTLFTSGGFITQDPEEKILVIIMIQGMLPVTRAHAVSEPSA